MLDVSALIALEARGFCWSVGNTRVHGIEARVWPRLQKHRVPVVIETGCTFADAIASAVERIGERYPRE